jgi:hypothetical protein
VALPSVLVSEATRLAPEGVETNFNRLVRTALEEYVERRRQEEFAAAMQRMAEDPEIQAEIQAVQRELAETEGDGL